jgi:hypothetical protein
MINNMKESEIQKAITDYLQILENQGKLFFFRSGSGCIRTVNGGYFKTGKKGCQDITVLKDGRYIALEVKKAKTYQSDSQKEVEGRILTCGGEYYVARNVDDVINILNT